MSGRTKCMSFHILAMKNGRFIACPKVEDFATVTFFEGKGGKVIRNAT